VPVPYGRFVEEVELHVPRFGLTITERQFALARDGQQMFGVLTCMNGHSSSDFALAIGLRNSYDRSLSAQLLAGSRVFVCDNLAFSGEAKASRKHTANVFRDLPDLIYRMLSQVHSLQERTVGEIAAMKARDLENQEADHLMVESIRQERTAGLAPAEGPRPVGRSRRSPSSSAIGTPGSSSTPLPRS
jgi:uncharacterized protein DUF932